MSLTFLSPKQNKYFYEPDHDFNILSGVTGSGKSFAANLKEYKRICSAKPRSRFIWSGKTLESLYDNVIDPIVNYIDMGCDWLDYKTIAGRPRVIVKPTMTQVIVIGANDEKAQDRIQGKSVSGWYADEVVKHPKSFIDMALSRCRYEKNGKLRVSPIVWTCNPDSPSHVIKTDYIDNKEIDVNNSYWGFYDNPLMTQDFIDKQKARYSGVFYERMIMGRWVLAEGVVYDKFDKTIHMKKDYPIDMVREYFLAVDWGYAKDHPLAILLIAHMNDGSYWIVDEIYVEQRLIDDQLKKDMKDLGWFNLPVHHVDGYINVIEKKQTIPSYCYADNADPANIQRLYDLIHVSMPGVVKDVESGIQSVQSLLKIQGNGKPRLYVLEKCINTIKEFENYRWDKKVSTNEGKNVPIQSMDHALDALRYCIHTRERGTAKLIDKDAFKS
jgi:PBSX family phage terminase large subunit